MLGKILNRRIKDKRAVALADAYLERNQESLERIPTKGEEVQIIDIGTHSKGAIFLDGIWAKTDALENEIDAVCRGYEGFYFGRFDLRAATIRKILCRRLIENCSSNGASPLKSAGETAHAAGKR